MLALLLVSVFCFTEAYVRIGESIRDVALSFAELFRIDVNSVSNVTTTSDVLVIDYEVTAASIANKFSRFGTAFVSRDNFLGYITHIFGGAYIALYVFLFAVLVFAFIVGYTIFNLRGHNNNYGVESLPLRVFKKIEFVVYIPVKKFLKEYLFFVKHIRAVRWILLVLALVSFNAVTIVLEALAYYLHFLSAMNFGGVFIQLQKLLADLSMLSRVPLIVWLIAAFLIFLCWRKNIALKRLYAREEHNRQFMKKCGSAVSLFAPMGDGKTRTGTDMALIKQQDFRNMAYDIMLEIDYLFPHFPWIKFENQIRELMNKHVIYHIYTAEKWAKNVRQQLDLYLNNSELKAQCDKAYRQGKLSDKFLYGYEIEKYGVHKNTGLKIEYLGEVLVEYAKAYFIYVSPTSMIFSNYAISVRCELEDEGNLPLWAWNSFGDVISIDEERQNAHILDMDMLRLGKKVKQGNENANAFEYGVVAFSEADKDRGNQFDTQELKKLSEEANQKNDNFNGTVKMSRQITNIRGRGFVFMFLDMQRLGSINLDIRELGDEIEIKESSEKKILVPFFALDELLYQLIVPSFDKKYTDFRYRRGDTNLTMYLLKKFVCMIDSHYKFMYNSYSSIEERVVLNDSAESIYYILPKKIYADVYSTDTTSAFFRKKASFSKKGINDIATFRGVRADFNELAQMNSYMVNSWIENLSELENDEKLNRRVSHQASPKGRFSKRSAA